MPELPEVETIRRVLETKLSGRTLRSADLRLPAFAATRLRRSLRHTPEQFQRLLVGRRLLRVRRRAKYLLLDLDQGTLLVHLGMTGQLFAAPKGSRPCCDLPMLPDKHTHLVIDLSGGQRLYFRDIRKFGSLRWLPDQAEEQKVFAAIGPEPLEKKFTSRVLAAGLAGKKASVKALLLNQRLVAGIGNIYADEALFRARIAPQRAGGKLTWPQIRRLHSAVREVLAEAIRFRGTTLSDYFDPESRRGGFQDRLRVYGRAGEPCVRCGRVVLKGVVAQRGTHWCPRCQKK
jgi:formamidopyrimidine-DNA glycosylase